MVVAHDTAAVWSILREVSDPEIPVLTIVDLGIVRHVRWSASGELEVGLTPTYSGCPATEVIHRAVERALARAGYTRVKVQSVLSPPWSSDWLTEEARQKLVDFGIAPPGQSAVCCPRCGSDATERLSEFGSTPCKAHFRCTDCLEPFDAFKCI